MLNPHLSCGFWFPCQKGTLQHSRHYKKIFLFNVCSLLLKNRPLEQTAFCMGTFIIISYEGPLFILFHEGRGGFFTLIWISRIKIDWLRGFCRVQTIHKIQRWATTYSHSNPNILLLDTVVLIWFANGAHISSWS